MNWCLRLLLGADEENGLPVGARVAHRVEGNLQVLRALGEVEDVDPVALRVDKRRHLGIPSACLVPEVGSDLEKVAHGYWCHSSPYTVIPPRGAFTTPKGHRSGASCSACVFRPLAGADVRFGRSGILARGAEPLGDPANEAKPLAAGAAKDQQEVDTAPLWEVGTLPPQCPHLAEAQEFRRRGGTQRGTATHLDRNEGAARITCEQVHLEPSKSQVARKDHPTARSQGARCKILSLTADN